MTLLVGLRGGDGLVVAADSRGTFGDPRGITAQNDSQKKLYITSKYSAVLTAGQGELSAALMEAVLKEIRCGPGRRHRWRKILIELIDPIEGLRKPFPARSTPGRSSAVPDAASGPMFSGSPSEQRAGIVPLGLID